VGPGKVCGEELAETIRSHLDLTKDTANAKYTKPALQSYAKLTSQAIAAGLAVDIFACSLDQVGLHEMKVLADKTGGFMVMSDSFSLHVFKNSFRKMLDCDEAGYLQLGFNANIEVLTSREFKCTGAIGGLCSLGKTGPCVADNVVGEGGTCRWVVGSLDRNTTIGFYFDITNQMSGALPEGKQSVLQFKTSYLHPSGRKRLRVTTVSNRYTDANMSNIATGFDQEAAAVLLARYAVWKCENEDPLDVLRWVDRALIRLVAKFADYRRNDITSFRLTAELSCSRSSCTTCGAATSCRPSMRVPTRRLTIAPLFSAREQGTPSS
jgi:protein transport protein SEC23